MVPTTLLDNTPKEALFDIYYYLLMIFKLPSSPTLCDYTILQNKKSGVESKLQE